MQPCKVPFADLTKAKADSICWLDNKSIPFTNPEDRLLAKLSNLKHILKDVGDDEGTVLKDLLASIYGKDFQTSKINWSSVTARYSEKIDGKKSFYKIPSRLSSYYASVQKAASRKILLGEASQVVKESIQSAQRAREGGEAAAVGHKRPSPTRLGGKRPPRQPVQQGLSS